MKRFFLLIALAAISVVAYAQATPTREQLKNYITNQAKSDTAIRAHADTLRALVDRSFDEAGSLRDSEQEILDMLIEEWALGGRATDRQRRLAAALGVAVPSSPTPAAPARPAAPKPKPAATRPKPATPKPAAPKPVAPKPAPTKLRAMAKRPAFTAAEQKAPGGRSIGVVRMAVDGRSATVVEVLSPGSLGVLRRAQVIQGRFTQLQRADPLWWMNLKVGTRGTQVIVESPRIQDGVVVTADAAFASEAGLSPRGLARMLIRKIRETMDTAAPGSALAGRSTEDQDEELRTQAVELRQVADGLYGTDPEAALAKYLEAIDTDGTYPVPYLRIADLHIAAKRTEDAVAILNKGIDSPDISEKDKDTLRAKLKTVSGS